MKKILATLLFIINSFIGYGQVSTPETCGFDKLLNDALADSTNSGLDSILVMIRRQVAANSASNKFSSTSSVVQPNNYVIPVVVHLVGTNASALTDAFIQAQLNLLNQGFENLLGSTYGVADDVQVKFCLAQTLPNGQPWANVNSYNPNFFYTGTAGITRCTTFVANSISNSHNMDATHFAGQQGLVNAGYLGFGFGSYLNIWVVNSISAAPTPYNNNIVGYSPFPLMMGPPNQYLDGVVMRLNGFGINSGGSFYNQGRTLIHEVGHYLGLFHTFQFGCSEVAFATPCASSGDECCDTPPVAVGNQNDCSILSSSPPNSCAESPNLPDQYENHMDYVFDNLNTCRNTFTNDQANRMHATIQLFRSSLVSVPNLIATGLTGVTGCLSSFVSPLFITNLPGGSTQVCTGQSIGFIASTGAASYNWSFVGGSPSSASGISNPTGIVWSTPGTYNITLNITDGIGNPYTSTQQIFVSNCIPYTGNRANWYFGNKASINFGTGIGVAQVPSSIQTIEASASISSNTGNLLLYTDGRTVWNSSHTPFINGNNTLNGSPNSAGCSILASNSQGVVIVPNNTNPNRHYIYTTSDIPTGTFCFNNLNRGISQYEVDVPANTVISTTPVHPSQNYAIYESIIAIPHCNGTDHWLVVKPKNNTQNGLINPGPVNNINQFFASYLVTGTGITNVPVLSSSAPLIAGTTFGGGNDGISQIAVSPDKKYIFFAESGSMIGYLYYFDCSSGILNYLATLPGISGFGICFSPNSKILYAKTAFGNIRQYNLNNLTQCQTTPPFVDFAFVPIGYTGPIIAPWGFFQLGPDGRIYLARYGGPTAQQFLGLINFPNMINSSPTSNECGFNFSAIPLLGGQYSGQDLPNDIIGTTSSIPDDFSFCIKNCNEACFTNLGCGINFSWTFGDGYSISGLNGIIPVGTNAGTTSGNFEFPCHIYPGPGTYPVTLSIDGKPIVIYNVVITAPPSPPVITGPNPVCSTSPGPFSYFGPPGFQYAWSATNGAPTTGNLQTFNVTWTSFPANLVLTITDPNNGCQATSAISITQTSTPPIVNAGPDVTVCPANPCEVLNATVSNGSLLWTPSTGLSCNTCLNPSACPGSTTTYVLSATNGCGTTTDAVTVNFSPVCQCPNCTSIGTSGNITSSPPTNGVYCINNSVNIIGTISFALSEFKIGPGVSIDVPSGSVLNIEGAHLYSCYDMWQGITIQPGGVVNIVNSLANYGDDQSPLIEDAIVAVDIGSSSSTGNILTVDDACFNRNRIGIRTIFYNVAVTNYPFTIVNSVFTCRDIQFIPNSNVWPQTSAIKASNNPISSPLETPYIHNGFFPQTGTNAFLKAPHLGTKSVIGIQLEAVGLTLNPATSPTYYEITIGGNGTPRYNVFDNLTICIDASSSNFTCINNVFQNTNNGLAGGGTVEGVGIRATAARSRNHRMRVIPGTPVGGFNNKFFNCHRAILTSDYFEQLIKFCDVRSTQNNPAPLHFTFQRGKYGFYMTTNRYRVIDVSDNQMYNIENAITFNGNYSFFIIPPLFTSTNGQYSGQIDINRNIIQPHLTGFPITTQYVENAIYVANAAATGVNQLVPGTTINQNGNQINKVNRGIYVANWGSKNINTISNCITLIDDPFFFPTTQFGVNHSNNLTSATLNGNLIFNNSVTGPNITNTLMHGVYSSMTTNQFVRCNTTQNTYSGIEFDGVPANLSLFLGNKMQTHQYGFVLNNNAVIGPQGSLTQPIDDQWLGTGWFPSGTNYKTLVANGASAISSKFHVRSSPAQYNPDGSGTFATPSTNLGVYSNPNGTIVFASGPVFACPSIGACPLPGPGPGGPGGPPSAISASDIQTMEQIALDQISYSINANESKFIGKNHLYRVLKADPSILSSSSILQSFYSAASSNSFVALADIEDDLSTSNFSMAQTKINSIGSVNNIENNYKKFYNLFVKNAIDSTGFDTNDSTTLLNLCNLCPHIDGAVIYQCRALYNSAYKTTTFFTDNCNQSNSKVFANNPLPSNTNFDVLVFPNPSIGQVNIAPFGIYEGLVDVKVKDVTGKIIFSNTIPVAKGNAAFNLEVKGGVYFIEIQDLKTKLQSVKKLIIQN